MGKKEIVFLVLIGLAALALPAASANPLQCLLRALLPRF